MLKHCLLLLLVTCSVFAAEEPQVAKAIDMKQIKGLKKLLKGLDAGVFTTCKLAFFSELVTYDEADKRCKNFNIGLGKGVQGNLATVNNEEKNTDLKILLEMAYPKKKQSKNKWADTRWVWAGMRKTKNNNKKKPGPYDPLDWEWADESNPEDFHKWMPKQPDQNSFKFGKKGCTESPRCYQNQMRINHDGAWDDTYKFKTHPYACDYSGKYVLSNEPKTWEKAKDACAAAGLHLAKIRSADEVEEIKSAMEYFLGPKDPTWTKWDNNNWIWFGGNRLEDKSTWKYLDGDTSVLWAGFPWIQNAGNDNAKFLHKGGQNVLAISRDGLMDDSFHNRKKKKRPFACQCPDT